MDRKLKISVVISLALIGLFTLAFTPYLPFFGPRRSLATNYLANNAVFDGFTQYMFKVADYSSTGLGDPKVFTFSGWVKVNTNNSGTAQFNILTMANNSDSLRYQLIIGSDAKVAVAGYSSAAANVLVIQSTNTIRASNGWTHIYVCCDVSTESNNKIYINGVLDCTNTLVRVDTAMDLSGVNYHYWVGKYISSLGWWNGGLSEIWFDDTYFDNPTKFYTNGCPVFLGSNGSVPTGSQPCFYFHDSGNNFCTNSGSCGQGLGTAYVFGITNGPLTTTNRQCL